MATRLPNAATMAIAIQKSYSQRAISRLKDTKNYQLFVHNTNNSQRNLHSSITQDAVTAALYGVCTIAPFSTNAPGMVLFQTFTAMGCAYHGHQYISQWRDYKKIEDELGKLRDNESLFEQFHDKFVKELGYEIVKQS